MQRIRPIAFTKAEKEKQQEIANEKEKGILRAANSRLAAFVKKYHHHTNSRSLNHDKMIQERVRAVVHKEGVLWQLSNRPTL